MSDEDPGRILMLRLILTAPKDWSARDVAENVGCLFDPLDGKTIRLNNESCRTGKERAEVVQWFTSCGVVDAALDINGRLTATGFVI